MQIIRLGKYAIGLIFSVALCLRAAEVPATPQPGDLGSAEIAAYIAIPNLSATMATAEQVAKDVNPNFQPGMLKMLLGMRLNDPGLANLGNGPVALFMFKAPPLAKGAIPDEPPVALFIPAKAAAPYNQGLAAAGLKTAFADGLLIAAKTPELLAKAQAQLPAYKNLAAAAVQADVRVYANIATLLGTYGQALDGAMESIPQTFANMPQPPNSKKKPEAVAKLLTLEAKGIAVFLKQINEAQLDLQLKPDALMQTQIITAQSGTALADLLNSQPLPGQSKTAALLSDKSLLKMINHTQPAALKAFLNSFLASLQKDPAFTALITPDFGANLLGWLDAFGGDFAMSYVTILPLKMEMAMTVTDNNKALSAVEKSMAMFGPTSSFGKIYSDMGLAFNPKLQKDVRKHATESVNRMDFNIDLSNIPPEEAAKMEELKMMPKEMELSFVNNMEVASTSPADLDTLIDKALAGPAAKPAAPLAAAKVFGEDKQFYCDMDLIGLIKAAVLAQPGNPMAMFAAMLKDYEPVAIAGSCTGGQLKIQSRMPLAPFMDIAKIISAMGQQQQAAPQPAPQPEPQGPGNV